jgi:aminoglycoside phosphotransferase (APT) family kinase protein
LIVRPGDPDPRAVRDVVRRVFGDGVACGIERMLEGTSTFVYRLRRGNETFYLRILPEVGDSFVAEALAHQLLRARGVRVPEVLYVEHLDAALGCSVMVTGEIPGTPLGQRPVDARTREIVVEAGRQLALFNSVDVRGFGWIKRDQEIVSQLEADHLTFRDWMLEYLDADLAGLTRARLLDDGVAEEIRQLVARPGALSVEAAVLAHGDFDLSHVFQLDGRYSGIIDLGEIRGADRWYDLGYVLMCDSERDAEPLLPWLLEGYGLETALPADCYERIAWSSVLIAVRAWARGLERSIERAQSHVALHSIPRDLRVLRG